MPPRPTILSSFSVSARSNSIAYRHLYSTKLQCRRHTPSLRHSFPHPRTFHSSTAVHAPRNPYDVLGVKKDSSAAEIKKTYFSLARKYHPDTNQDKDAQAKFLEIQEAYDILKDDKKRAAYDQFGSTSQQPGFDPNAFGGGFQGGASYAGFEDFARAFGGGGRRRSARAGEDLFETLFSSFAGSNQGGFKFTQSSRGGDVNSTVNISFLEACKGTKRKINISPIVSCRTCSGSGLKRGAKRTACTTCGGTGQQTFVIQSGFHMASTCNSCEGTGTTIPKNGECSSCGGVGRVREKRTVEVDIPAGVEDGMEIRVPNAGDAPSADGMSGDLLVRINVAPSKTFVRQGQHVYHVAQIPLHVALLGGRVRIPTLDGDAEVRIPAGTQQGEEMVLKGRGVPQPYRGAKGDQFVTFSVQIPRSLTPKQKDLLQQYAEDFEGRTSRTSTSDSSSGSNTSSSSSKDPSTAPKNADERSSDEMEKKKKTATG